MIRLLNQRVKAGVDVRVIGKVGKRGGDLRVQKLPGHRLHVRAMIRDGDTAFVGSQSLRALELDARREVGLIVKDPKVVKRMLEVFEEDWAKTDLGARKEAEGGEEGTEERGEVRGRRRRGPPQTPPLHAIAAARPSGRRAATRRRSARPECRRAADGGRSLRAPPTQCTRSWSSRVRRRTGTA